MSVPVSPTGGGPFAQWSADSSRLRADSVRRGESVHSVLLAALSAEGRLMWTASAHGRGRLSDTTERTPSGLLKQTVWICGFAGKEPGLTCRDVLVGRARL